MKIIEAIRAWWNSLGPPPDPPPALISEVFALPLKVEADDFGANLIDRNGRVAIEFVVLYASDRCSNCERRAEAVLRLIEAAWQREIEIEAADARVW